MTNPTTPSICCHTTLWNINVRKQAINDKLQGSVAKFLRCGGLSITKLRKVYCWVCRWNFYKKSVNIWQTYTHEGGCLVRFVRLATVIKDEESARHNPHFLPVTIALVFDCRSFSDTDVSQGSVATHMRCRGICTKWCKFTGKNVENRLRTNRDMAMSLASPFICNTVQLTL